MRFNALTAGTLAQIYWVHQARKIFVNRLSELIARRRKEGGNHRDILQQFLDAGQDGRDPVMSDAEITDNLITMLFAAYDTSAITMTWILKLLSYHPQALKQVQVRLWMYERACCTSCLQFMHFAAHQILFFTHYCSSYVYIYTIQK